MKLAIIIGPHAEHQRVTAAALKAGAEALGDSADILPGPMSEQAVAGYDAVCAWGWRRAQHYSRTKNVLVMERAYVGDRFHWVSLGWNGLNGRARWPNKTDPSRWEQYFASLMHPRVERNDGYALLLGQVPTDSAVAGINLGDWLTATAKQLRGRGWDVLFRPHPKATYLRLSGVRLSSGMSLAEDLAGASVAVTFNSNSGVDAALSGIPVMACDRGSMAWDVASHSPDEPVSRRDRLPWAHRLAWRQWQPQEIASGFGWQHVREALHG